MKSHKYKILRKSVTPYKTKQLKGLLHCIVIFEYNGERHTLNFKVLQIAYNNKEWFKLYSDSVINEYLTNV